MQKIIDLYDLNHSVSKELLLKYMYPYEALPHIKEYVIKLGNELNKAEYNEIKENVWIHNDSIIYESACILAPTIVGANTEVRHCAFIRGSVLIGEGCVIGNSVEIKNSIIFDGAQIPHFNYVGDSIIGYKAHMGAGSITSNVKSDKSLVVINGKETKLKKVGAFLGDYVEIGCNSVLTLEL